MSDVGAKPQQVRLRRFTLEALETRLVELPAPGADELELPGADWLPPDLHRLAIHPSGVAQVVEAERRGRPARVPLFNGRALSFRSAPLVTHGDCASFGPSVSAMFLATEHLDPELEARLAEDLSARAVYADALEEAGDPFGNALALAGPEGAPPPWVLNEVKLPLLELDATWRHGFVEQAQVSLLEAPLYPAGLLRVLHLRVFCVARSLTVRIDVANAVDHPLDPRLAAHLPTSLREFQLILGLREAALREDVDRLLEQVRIRCPGIEATVAIDPSRADPSVARMHLNLRGRSWSR